jgi:hypothetical protein
MKVTLIAAFAALFAVIATSPADARRYQPSEETGGARNFWEDQDTSSKPQRKSRQARKSRDTSSGDVSQGRGSVASVGGRPSKWCGWYMRTRHGGGPEMNIAWNWSRYGHAASPQVGAIVVWPHHVGEIVGQAPNGQWIVLSGNDSGRVRQRPRSISGAVIRMG